MDKNHSKLEQEKLLSEISDSIGKQIQDVMEEENEREKPELESSQTEETQPDSTQTEDAPTEEVQADNEQAENGQSEEAQPDNEQAENGQSEEVQADNEQAENGQAEEAQPDNAQTEDGQPGGENSGSTQTDADGQPDVTAPDGTAEGENPPKKKKMSRRKKVVLGILGTITVLVIALLVFINHELNQINYETRDDISYAKSTATTTVAPVSATPEPESKEVINILLIGEESIHDGDGNGRSDSMMIATINCEQKTLKLTSLMRDIYVDIPGYSKNKLNAAFHNGGGFLAVDTIEQNFNVDLAGYVRVDFEAFETIVDKLGGVEIELTSSEAYYLNRTNYISDPSSRNVREGTQVLNGSQALGYCRVRYQTASDGEHDDFGRTYRQRTVLKAIFDKYKSKNPVEMVSIGTDLLPYVTTNLTKSQLVSYLTTAASFGTMELETLRIPVDNSHYGDKDYCGSVRRYVLKIDFDVNNAALQEFIYGIPSGPAITSGSSVTAAGGTGGVSAAGTSGYGQN